MKLNVIILLLFIGANDAVNTEKRLIQEMDIEQEILNLKQSLAKKDVEIAALNSLVTNLQQQIGSTYTRWGRTICPGNGTTLIYSGYMGGTLFDRSSGHGTGANYLCLSDQPTWDYYSEKIGNQIRITGVEYQFTHDGSTTENYDLQKFFGSNIYNSEAPCSVCRSERATSVMIPGRKDCYPGWTKEYSGYLVGAYPGYDDASEYVCLDRRPETVVNSGNDDNENNLYFVEASCGKSLECPPYVHNRELACVVCTK